VTTVNFSSIQILNKKNSSVLLNLKYRELQIV